MKTITVISNINSQRSTVLHTPVLLREVLQTLNPQEGEIFIDGTYGGGGHSAALLERLGAQGKMLAVDWSEYAMNVCAEQWGNDCRVTCVMGNFAELPAIMRAAQFPKAHGLLLDLGISSDQLEYSGRGFSFNSPDGGNEPLLMTYNDAQEPVRDILKKLDENKLTEILKQYGEERRAKTIARAIIKQQQRTPIETTEELVRIIIAATPRRGRLHPATRACMALRIYANRELENLTRVLNSLPEIIMPYGRVVVISFHSLEDRIVKNHFRDLARAHKAQLITKKPIIPSYEEIMRNPRSRSGKLRAIQMLV